MKSKEHAGGLLPPESPFHPFDPERFLYENAHCVAFLDRYPVSEGHALVVPRRLVVSFFELEPEQQAAVWNGVREVRDMLVERYAPAGFNIGINDGEAAGQTVLHAHIHLIPRYGGDCPDPRGGIRWVIPEKARYW